MSLLEIKDVSFSYDTKYQHIQVMDHINCAFEEGKVTPSSGNPAAGRAPCYRYWPGWMCRMKAMYFSSNSQRQKWTCPVTGGNVRR